MRLRKKDHSSFAISPDKGYPYRCSLCGRTYLRDSQKAWIKSFCERGGKYARLVRVKEEL